MRHAEHMQRRGKRLLAAAGERERWAETPAEMEAVLQQEGHAAVILAAAHAAEQAGATTRQQARTARVQEAPLPLEPRQ